MKLLLALSLLSLGCTSQSIDPSTQRKLYYNYYDYYEYDTSISTVATDKCSNWITSGDAETGNNEDWSPAIQWSNDAPFGSTVSYKMLGAARGRESLGPSQTVDVSCFESGKQYKLTAKLKIIDAFGRKIGCNKHAEYFDTEYCPLFTIYASTPFGNAQFNLGNSDISEWLKGEWNTYNAVFTVDNRLASATSAELRIRGPRPGVDIYFDDVKVEEYLGLDTMHNFWSTAPLPEGTSENECITRTKAESSTATPAILIDNNIVYKHHTDGPYDAAAQCAVVNGDAESNDPHKWLSMGSEGGSIVVNNNGPKGATKSFMHADRPNKNSGPGQENIDVSCFKLFKRYEIKAKIKLVDENGFPYACNKIPSSSACDTSCPLFKFVHLSNSEEKSLPIPNSITDPWIAEEFNEYHAIFEVSQTFLDSVAPGFFFSGPRAGVSIIFDDVSITEYEGDLETTNIVEVDALDGPCSSLVKSGDADTGNVNDWAIKDIMSGEFLLSSDAPDGNTQSYQHKGREHVSSGPGQPIATGCLVEGKQYIITAQVKIVDEEFGAYTCDKFASWKDPDFCPIFTIWVEEPDGHEARYNLGNDYPLFENWQENEFNPYYAIFTVDDRLAATNNAYLYLRGPRPKAAMYFTDVSIKEYVGTDTRNNFWTALAPLPDITDEEIADALPDWEAVNPEDLIAPDRVGYIYYKGKYAEHEASSKCGQLVKNGDAEPGIFDGWRSLGDAGGLITENHEGPVDPFGETKSFRHVNRGSINTGPGQVLDLPCLELGKIYEVKAKIKMYDRNGFPFRCEGNYWKHDLSCPLFTIYAKQPTGEWQYINKWNDIKEIPWYANHFNEFHAFFQVDMDLLGAAEAYWYFRGPRGDVSIALDDVSIKLYKDQMEGPPKTIVKPAGCQELTYNGDASQESISGWISHDGVGYVTLDSDGPQGNDGPVFKQFARSHASNGPGQVVDISCLENGRKYKVTASYFLEDGRGDPFQCNTLATWNTPYFCPMFTLAVDQPWGPVRWNFYNRNQDPPTAGWNLFWTEFEIGSGTEFPDQSWAYFRGPSKDMVFYFNNVTVTMIEDVPEKPKLEIPPRDPNLDCANYCCEMAKNGDAENGVFGWVTRPQNDGSLTLLDVGANGSSKSIRHVGRGKLNSGPGQMVPHECLENEKLYEITAQIAIFDENDEAYACDKNAKWDDHDFCPLFSIWYKTGDWVSYNHWLDAPNEDTSEWVPGAFNRYHAIFKIDEDLSEAIETSFVFRGVPKGAQIVVDDVSFKPYNHAPEYVPPVEDVEPEFDFFLSASTLEVNPWRLPTCDIPIFNGDFEMGTTAGWFVNHGGELGIVRCDNKGGQYCLKTTQRTNKYMGPKAILELDCLQVGKTFDVFADIQLRDENWNTVGCDKLAGRYSFCPIFTLHYTTAEGEEKWLYSANHALSPWEKDKMNDFYGRFEVTEELAAATDAYFYFERAAPGVSMIIDNVAIDELITEPDTDYREMTNTCKKFVLNGDAETAELRGWVPRLGGELILHDEGADLTQHSIMHTGRRSFMMGPKHDIAVDCFTGGMVYTFEAKVKLIDDETGQPFLCDKQKRWIDDDACPLLTMKLILADLRKKWLYFNSETKEDWKADKWNLFQFNFQVNEEMAYAKEGYFYMERVKAGVSILIDEVSITRDCSILIPNHNAEFDEVLPWYQHGPGEIDVIKGGANRSPNAFASTGRKAAYAGPTHHLDVECLTIGSKYVFTASVKILDAVDGHTPFQCDKNAGYGSYYSCTYFTLALTYPDEGSQAKYLTFKNIDQSEWVANKFNIFKAEFEVNQDIYDAVEARMIIHGPREGMTILFDETSLELRVADHCENLIPNGHFDTIEELESWSVEDNGNIQFVPGGVNGDGNALMCSGRLATSDGPMTLIDHMCMYEGVVYEFTAYLKLLDANNNPFECDKTAAYGTPLACPILGIEMRTGSEFIQVHPENTVDAPWVADGWNMVKSVFVVSNDLANAEWAHFKFKGAAPGVSILIDEMKTELYQYEKVDCNQLIYKTNAEDGFTSGWDINGGGYMEVIDGGDNSTKAFAHMARVGHHAGPKQNIETLCLEEGQKYDLNARFKFLDYVGNPVGCDKSAGWKTPDYCILISFNLEMKDGRNLRRHIGNSYGGPWIADEFNSFTNVITVDADMANAQSVYFWIQGPSQDKVIVMDNISLKLQEEM